MKIYVTFTKGRIIALTALIIVLISVAVQITAVGKQTLNGSDNNSRIEFINDLGLNVEENPEKKDVIIPAEFSDVYKKYNALQKQADFNLEKYKGKSATVYSYSESGSDRIINLIVCDGEIIGGDISETAFNGNMKPLKKD